MAVETSLRDTSARPRRPGLHALNGRFSHAFATACDAARRDIERGAYPVFVRLDDRLLLVLGNERVAIEVAGEPYHELKAIAHVPLAVYLTIAAGAGASEREALGRELAACEGGADDAALAAVLRESAKLLDRADAGEPDDAECRAYARAVQGAFDRVVTQAAAREVEALAGAMQELQQRIDPALWPRTYYVVCAGHQPRYKQLTKMFFLRWVETRPGACADARHRVLYAEGRENVDEALALAASRLANGRLAEVFLHSPLSLDEDVLGDAARAALERHFGPRG